MATAVTPSSASTFLDPNDPIFNEPQLESLMPMHWLHCRQFVRELRACIGGCGRYVVVSRTRCHNVYMCDNCGSARLRTWLWLSQRDLPSLKIKEQTGIEVTIPKRASLSDSETTIRILVSKLIKAMPEATGMPVVDPESGEITIRFMLQGRQNWTILSRQWRQLTDDQGTLTLRHYSPNPNQCYVQFLEWVFRGTSPLAQYDDQTRMEVMQELKGSRRLISFGKGDFYSPLPIEEQKSRREAQRQAHMARLCPCCGSALDEIPREEQETLTIENMQVKHHDSVIAYEQEYNPFWTPRGDVSIAASRNISGTFSATISQPTHSPPS